MYDKSILGMMRPEPKQNWSKWYVAVLAVLLLQIVLYYWFTQHWA